jgi:hypothetical protein
MAGGEVGACLLVERLSRIYNSPVTRKAMRAWVDQRVRGRLGEKRGWLVRATITKLTVSRPYTTCTNSRVISNLLMVP